MIRKTFILSLFVFMGCSIHMMGQNNKKQAPIVLGNKLDSIAYALGQNMTNGLKDYLKTVNVLKDTSANALIEDYSSKYESADQAGKAALKKELTQKQEEAEKANDENFTSFLQGLESALANTNPKTNSYNTGISVGNQLSSVSERFEKEMLSGEKLNKNIFSSSIVSALNGQEPLIQDAEQYIQQVAIELQQASEIKRAEELKELHGERISEGVRFFAENKTKEGVVSLPNGLQYKILTEGTGQKPTISDRVKVHYEGKLLDGTIFDSSYQRGAPSTFGVTQVIKGWTEILQEMPVGSKWTVYIPYDLAYGDRDQGQIKPFSTLIFDIELIEIVE